MASSSNNYLHFGAGNIGRGLLGQLCNEINTSITFIDTNIDLITEIKKTSSYKITCIPSNKKIRISNFRALDSLIDFDKVADEISNSTFITTSIGISNLQKIAPVIISALDKRTISSPLAIACFENGYRASEILWKGIIKEDPSLKNKCGYINVIVDRLVPSQNNNKSLDVIVEDFYSVWYQKQNDNLEWHFKNSSQINNYDSFFKQKFYGVNGLHFAIALIGIHNNKTYISDVLEDEKCKLMVRDLINEITPAIASLSNQTEGKISSYLRHNLERFANPDLKDELVRIARNAHTKLQKQERLMPLFEWLKNNNRMTRMIQQVIEYGITYCAKLGFEI